MARALATIPREAKLREKANRQLRKLAQEAPQSLAAHAALCHRTDRNDPLTPAPVHAEILRILQDRVNFRWVVIVVPPAYGKSTWVSVAYPSWRIGVEKGRIRIGLISNTSTQAEGFGSGIAATIESTRYQRVYGVKPDYRQGWSQNQRWVSGSLDKVNPTLMCAGHGSDIILGKRFDEIILDDPTTWDEARSPATMEGQKFWLKGTLLKRFPAGLGPPDGEGRMVVVLTRWSDDDLVEEFRNLGFKIVTIPALGWWDRRVTCAECKEERDPELYAILQRCEHCDSTEPPDMEWGEEPLWPEQETKEALEDERELEPITFELVKQGDTRAVSGDTFDVHKFNYGPLPEYGWESVAQYVDTASGMDRAKGDYFVIATIGIREEGLQAWIIDLVRDRVPAPEQEKLVAATFERMSALASIGQVVIETKNEGIALWQRLVTSTRLPLIAFSPEDDKEFRAIPWANMVNSGRVWIPEGARWRMACVNEHKGFPKTSGRRKDDIVDSCAGAFNHTDATGPRIRVLR